MRNYSPRFLLVETEFGNELMINYNDINTIEPCSKDPDTRTVITFTDASLNETRVLAKIGFGKLAMQMGGDVRSAYIEQ